MPRAKKHNILSLAMDEEMQEFLKALSKSTNVSVSKIIRDLVDTHLRQGKKITVIYHDDAHVPVVLRVPTSLRGDKDGLLGWLRSRVAGIAERLAAPRAPAE